MFKDIFSAFNNFVKKPIAWLILFSGIILVEVINDLINMIYPEFMVKLFSTPILVLLKTYTIQLFLFLLFMIIGLIIMSLFITIIINMLLNKKTYLQGFIKVFLFSLFLQIIISVFSLIPLLFSKYIVIVMLYFILFFVVLISILPRLVLVVFYFIDLDVDAKKALRLSFNNSKPIFWEIIVFMILYGVFSVILKGLTSLIPIFSSSFILAYIELILLGALTTTITAFWSLAYLTKIYNRVK